MMAHKPLTWTTTCLVTALLICGATSNEYRGKPLGKLSQLHHAVSGEVYAVDARTLHIRNFNYDGEGPAAYFYVGTSKTPSGSGFRIRDERGTTNVLPRYKNQDITLSLPEGKTLQNIRWFSVWCDEFAVNFGDVKIPKGFEFPRPHKLGALSGIHGVSSDQVVIVDAQTLLIPNFSYDGEAPDAKFWVGQGSRPTPQGIRIPDENGKTTPLRRYDRKTIVLTLPGEMTVFDIGHFGVWCEAFTVDFGHVLLPQGLNVPPSLKMLGVSPQKRSRSLFAPNYIENSVNEESREEPIARPLFYKDFRVIPREEQDIKPTTYRPNLLRKFIPQRQVQNSEIEIQQSISVPHSSEFVIHEESGDFVKPLEVQFSRRQETRYQPTPAEKILQHNPAEPPLLQQLQAPQHNAAITYNNIPQNNFVQHLGPVIQRSQSFSQHLPVVQPQFIQQQQQQLTHQPLIQQQTAQFNQQPVVIHQQPVPLDHQSPPQLIQQQILPQQQQQILPQQHQPILSQQFVQQPLDYQQPPPSSSTNHFGKVFNQMNVEANVNHNPQLGAGSFSRFVINRSTDSGFFHRL